MSGDAGIRVATWNLKQAVAPQARCGPGAALAIFPSTLRPNTRNHLKSDLRPHGTPSSLPTQLPRGLR